LLYHVGVLRRGSAQALRDFGVIAASADQIDRVRIGVIVDMRQIDLNLACNGRRLGIWERSRDSRAAGRVIRAAWLPDRNCGETVISCQQYGVHLAAEARRDTPAGLDGCLVLGFEGGVCRDDVSEEISAVDVAVAEPNEFVERWRHWSALAENAGDVDRHCYCVHHKIASLFIWTR
jgi:hypothetical protein